MSNLRLFSLAVFAVTLGISGGATSRRVVSLDEIFQTAEQNSATLRASEAAREEARRDISVARSQRLPDINASLGLSYIGDGFTGAVVGETFGPAIVGELLSRLVAKNSALLGTRLTDVFVSTLPRESLGDIMSQTMRQALAVSMKEIYGWMLIGCLAFIVVIAVSYSPLRPKAIFPSWATIRRIVLRPSRVVRQLTVQKIFAKFVGKSIYHDLSRRIAEFRRGARLGLPLCRQDRYYP